MSGVVPSNHKKEESSGGVMTKSTARGVKFKPGSAGTAPWESQDLEHKHADGCWNRDFAKGAFWTISIRPGRRRGSRKRAQRGQPVKLSDRSSRGAIRPVHCKSATELPSEPDVLGRQLR